MRDNDWDEDDIKAATKDVREIYDSYANYWKVAQEARGEIEGDDNLSDMDEEVSTARSSINVLDHEYANASTDELPCQQHVRQDGDRR
jgi:hypothetical protein